MNRTTFPSRVTLFSAISLIAISYSGVVSAQKVKKSPVETPLTIVKPDCSNVPIDLRPKFKAKGVCTSIAPDSVQPKASVIGGCGRLTTFIAFTPTPGIAVVEQSIKASSPILGVQTWSNNVTTTSQTQFIAGPTRNAKIAGTLFDDFINVRVGAGTVSSTNLLTIAETTAGFCFGFGSSATIIFP